MKALEILRMEDMRRNEARRLGIEFIEHPSLAADSKQTYDSDIVDTMAANYRRTIY